MEALFGLILLAAVMGLFLWKYPALMKEIFSFKKPEIQPAAQPTKDVAQMPHYGQAGYENIGFINEPLAAPVVEAKHQIIQHRYNTEYHDGYWPEWVCKCGDTGYVVVHYLRTLEEAQKQARIEGAAHVKNANKAEELLKKTNGKFAW